MDKITLNDLTDWSSFVKERNNELLAHFSMEENAESLYQLLKYAADFDASLKSTVKKFQSYGLPFVVLFDENGLLLNSRDILTSKNDQQRAPSSIRDVVLSLTQNFVPPPSLAEPLRKLKLRAGIKQVNDLHEAILMFIVDQIWDLKNFYKPTTLSMAEDLHSTLSHCFRRIIFRDRLEASQAEELFDLVSLLKAYSTLSSAQERSTLASHIWHLFLDPPIVDIEHNELQNIQKNLKAGGSDLFRALFADQQDRLSDFHHDFRNAPLNIPFESKDEIKRALLAATKTPDFIDNYPKILSKWIVGFVMLGQDLKETTACLETAIHNIDCRPDYPSSMTASSNFVGLVTELWTLFLPTFHRYLPWLQTLDSKEKDVLLASYFKNNTKSKSRSKTNLTASPDGVARKKSSDTLFKLSRFSSKETLSLPLNSPSTQRTKSSKSKRSPRVEHRGAMSSSSSQETARIDLGPSHSKGTTLCLLIAFFCEGKLKNAELAAGIAALPHFYPMEDILKTVADILVKLTSNTAKPEMEAFIGVANTVKQLIASFYREFDANNREITNTIIKKITEIHPALATFLDNLTATQKSVESCQLLLGTVAKDTGRVASNLLSYPVKSLAQQLCIRDQAQINSIPLTEFHKTNWTKKGGAPVLTKIATFADNLVFKFVHEIKSAAEKSIKKSLDLLINLVELGTQLHYYQNYNALILVYLALQRPELTSLSKAWALLPKRYLSQVESISSLFNPSKNFFQYRSAMVKCNGSYLQCREIVLQDLLFLTESQPDWEREMINCSKLLTMGELILGFKSTFNEVFSSHPAISTDLDILYDCPEGHYAILLGATPRGVNPRFSPPTSPTGSLAIRESLQAKRRSASVPDKLAAASIGPQSSLPNLLLPEKP